MPERKANKEEEDDKIIEFNEQKQKKLENIKIEDLIKGIKDPNLMDKYSEEINASCPLFKENNFILSKNSIEKYKKVYRYMNYQVPCILKGETGTSKSLTSSMMAKYCQ